MRKSLMFVLVFILIGTYAAAFSPTLLELSAPAQIEYKGGALEFDVTVTGTPAHTIFMVFTKDQGSTISDTMNGYLGWHYVNQIDTCMFVSDPYEFGTGVNSITWTGNDADGNAVPAGEGTSYQYYLYAFDHVNAKQLAAPVSVGWDSSCMWRQYDADGMPIIAPEFYPTIRTGGAELGLISRNKWIMGGDVTDTGLIETCTFNSYFQGAAYVPDPNSNDGFFSLSIDASFVGHVHKYQWVPNGEGVLDDGWGDSGEVTYTLISAVGEWVSYAGAQDIGNDRIIATATDLSGTSTESILKVISVSGGYVETDIDLSDFWIRMDEAILPKTGQQASGPSDVDFQNGMLVLGSHSSCMNQMIDPNADDLDDPLSFNRWVNQNGDYTGDHNFEDTADNAWVCHDYNVAPYKYNTATDGLNFVAFPSYGCGAVSHGLYAPDGTGLGYKAFAGENDAYKNMAKFLDCDSAYDGIYCDATNLDNNKNLHFVGQDSFNGELLWEVSVEEDAPAQFAVSQNSPNPFNPTTTISFEIAEPGNVTIDVYNVAGQKVDTIVNDHMEDGTHSSVWDASGFSAGVYFYTVKSGNLSKTMKMTLLK